MNEMNIKEAIDWIKQFLIVDCEKCNRNNTKYCDIDYCYHETTVLKGVLTVLEKQIPKTVISESNSPTKCPFCGNSLFNPLADRPNRYLTRLDRCPNCDQRLKWEE